MSLDGFSMHPLTEELTRILSGSRIDKISQPTKQSILLQLRQPGQNYTLHLSVNAQNPVIHLMESSMENPPEPPVFCMVLRKHLEGGRIAEIRQHGLDRILLIDMDTIGPGGLLVTKTLVVELMGKYSNLILLQDQTIIDALRRIGRASSRVRLVLPGCPYELPPHQNKANIFQEPLEEILLQIKDAGELTLYKALIACCQGIGPMSAKEICFGAGLSPSLPVSHMDDADFSALQSSLQETISLCLPENSSPTMVTDMNGKLLAMSAFPLHFYEKEISQTYPSMSQLLEVSGKILGQYVPPEKDRYRKLVHTEIVRAKNKAVVLEDELLQANNADDFKIRADNLMTYQYQLTDHEDTVVELPDIYKENGEMISIPLDKRYTIIQNMQSYYHKYDKLKRARLLLEDQLRQCHQNIQYLESIQTSLLSCSSLAEIHDVKAELIVSGYLNEKPKKKMGEKPSRPFSFTAPDGTQILVGKNNYQNDILTFKTAHHNDIWLHTTNIPGSHVIIRCENTPVQEETLLLAASLSAYFSQAQDSSKVPVDYTRCRYVKKPSGAKPGFVIFTNQKTLYITPEKEQLLPLLQTAKLSK